MSTVTVLLVEDNEMNRDMLSRRLRARGFDVRTAANGFEGVAVAAECLPDVVLMDMSLPVLDGWEATRRLKADPATCRIPVVALTAHAMVSDRDRSIEAGCDDYDTKPIDISRLIEKIDRLVERRGEHTS